MKRPPREHTRDGHDREVSLMPTAILPIRPRRLRTRLALVGMGALAVTGALALPAEAHADPAVDYAAKFGPAVCSTLDRFPSFAGIEGVGDAIHYNDGFSYWDAGRIERLSVTVFCPWHAALLDLYVATYAAPQSAPVSQTYVA